MSLRLGVLCAVIDDQQGVPRLLLSRRSDLNVWTLPGGRLDSGEKLEDAAARETHEETGLVAHVEEAVGLYYLSGWRRMNILYRAIPLGGDLRKESAETRGNAFFTRDTLPKMPMGIIAYDALSEIRQKPRVFETPPAEMRRLRVRFALRWLGNRLRGRPEPRFPKFQVEAVAVILSNTHRVLTLAGDQGRALPRVVCNGETAPWLALCERVGSVYGAPPALHWVGVWQDAPDNRLEFVFAAQLPEKPLAAGVEWSGIRNTPLPDLDAAYVERVKPTFAHDPIWTIHAQEPQITMITTQKKDKTDDAG